LTYEYNSSAKTRSAGILPAQGTKTFTHNIRSAGILPAHGTKTFTHNIRSAGILPAIAQS
jgi:hypothetical protein